LGKEHLVKNRLIFTLDNVNYSKETIFQEFTYRTSHHSHKIGWRSVEKNDSLFSVPTYIHTSSWNSMKVLLRNRFRRSRFTTGANAIISVRDDRLPIFCDKIGVFLVVIIFVIKLQYLLSKSPIVSACHRRDWSYGSWDRIPPGYRVEAFFSRKKEVTRYTQQKQNSNT
jgi:hypothetical protein